MASEDRIGFVTNIGAQLPSNASGSIGATPDRPLVDVLLEKLENLILEGDLKPGDRLKEKSLALKWNVSRGPIREACRILQEAGLVDILPNRGVLVRQVDVEDVLHEFDIRAALWRLGAREAARNLSHRQMDHLDQLIARMATVIDDGDVMAYLELNTQFHDAIVVASGNRPLVALQRRLFLQARLFRRQSLEREADLTQRNDDHRAIVSAFRRGDHEEAGHLCELHVLKSKDRFSVNVQVAAGHSTEFLASRSPAGR